MDDVYAFLHNDTRNVAEWGSHAHSRSPLPPHVGPLTAELTEDDSLGGESEHSPALPRSPRLRTSCESGTRKIHNPHFRAGQVQLQGSYFQPSQQ